MSASVSSSVILWSTVGTKWDLFGVNCVIISFECAVWTYWLSLDVPTPFSHAPRRPAAVARDPAIRWETLHELNRNANAWFEPELLCHFAWVDRFRTLSFVNKPATKQFNGITRWSASGSISTHFLAERHILHSRLLDTRWQRCWNHSIWNAIRSIVMPTRTANELTDIWRTLKCLWKFLNCLFHLFTIPMNLFNPLAYLPILEMICTSTYTMNLSDIFRIATRNTYIRENFVNLFFIFVGFDIDDCVCVGVQRWYIAKLSQKHIVDSLEMENQQIMSIGNSTK